MKRVGVSMDGGFVYSDGVLSIKMLVEPSQNIHTRLRCNIREEKIFKHEALYKVSQYHVPRSYFCRKFVETPEFYNDYVLSHIENSKLPFVCEHVVHEDKQTILMRDVKYKEGSPYYVLYVKDESIMSVRDLRGEHISLLNKCKNIISICLKREENVDEDEIRMYIHYPPGVWRFHIHANLYKDKWESTSMDYGISLENAINNIMICSDYYKKSYIQTLDRFRPPTNDYFFGWYISKYFPDILSKNFEYQERQRKNDAELYFNGDTYLSLNGKSTLANIRESFHDANITEEFRSFIKDTLNKERPGSPSNVRKTVRKVWMYPYTDYLPFQEFHIYGTQSIIKCCNAFSCKTNIEIIEGRVYMTIPGFNDWLWSNINIRDVLKSDVQKHQQTPDRIHILHSYEVSECDRKDLDDLISQFQDLEWDIEFKNLCHTLSLDWSPFSLCIVVKLTSDSIAKFIMRFNKIFDKNINPSLHRTIGALYRK